MTVGQVTIIDAGLRIATNVLAGTKPRNVLLVCDQRVSARPNHAMSYSSYPSCWSCPAPSARSATGIRASGLSRSADSRRAVEQRQIGERYRGHRFDHRHDPRRLGTYDNKAKTLKT